MIWIQNIWFWCLLFLVTYVSIGYGHKKHKNYVSNNKLRRFHHSLPAIPPKLSIKPYIVNGKEASIEDYPYAAFVFGDAHSCSGSVISEYYIITSAHCHTDVIPIKHVIVGTTDVTKHPLDGEKIKVEHVFIHPRYNSSEGLIWNNDIAIVKLSKAIQHTKVRPILLSAVDKSDERPSKASIAGWGKSDHNEDSPPSNILLEAKNRIITLRNCKIEYIEKAYGISIEELNSNDINYYEKTIGIDISHVCTKRINGGSTSRGDSGGPLVIPGKNESILVGVTSGGVQSKNSDEEFPDFFASVANAKDFIDSSSVGHKWHNNVESEKKDDKLNDKDEEISIDFPQLPSSKPSNQASNLFVYSTIVPLYLCTFVFMF